MKKINQCPYCKHEFIFSGQQIPAEENLLSILKIINEGARNLYRTKENTDLCIGSLIRLGKILIKEGLIKRYKSKSDKHRFEYKLNITKQGKKLLDDLK